MHDQLAPARGMAHGIIIGALFWAAVLSLLGGCAIPVRAYPPHDAQGAPTPLPVIVKKTGNDPVEPGNPLGQVPWMEIILSLLGVKVGGDMLKGGARVIASKIGKKTKP